MDIKRVGSFIAALRKQKGYTQKELAEKISVTDKAISRWETGKGLPDTSILKPLSDVLGVSVGELLSGEHLEEQNMKEQTDNIIIDSLNYSKKMLLLTVEVILYLLAAGLLLAPIYVAGNGHLWIIGLFLLMIAIFYTYFRKCQKPIRFSNRVFYLISLLPMLAAFILEILPYGAVCIFADGPEKRITQTFSYFSLTPYGYANFTPLLTGMLTVAILILGILSLIWYANMQKVRKAAFICTVIALLLSLVPLVLFGAGYMNAVSYSVSGFLLLSLGLQIVANRKD